MRAPGARGRRRGPARAPVRLFGRVGVRPVVRLAARLAVLGLVVSPVAACSAPAAGPAAPASRGLVSSPAPVASRVARPARGSSLVATARGRAVEVRSAPGEGRRLARLADPTATGGPLTFLVLSLRPGWARVQLPQRPNGSTGWVATGDVTLTTTPYALVVHRRSHRLEVWRDGARRATYPVGVGRSVTPTPGGTYFLTELLEQPSPDGPYGPYAFGLSAFSDTLTSYAGGPGQLGLHGTDAPELVGTDVSHGCLRVTNAVITALARQLPLGTPVRITR